MPPTTFQCSCATTAAGVNVCWLCSLRNATLVMQWWKAPGKVQDGEGASETKAEDDGQGSRLVALSLAEAESLRAAQHHECSSLAPSVTAYLSPTSSQDKALVVLRTSDGRALDFLGKLPEKTPAECQRTLTRSAATVWPALQFIRFFDAQLSYSDEEIIGLLKALQAVTLEERALYFQCVALAPQLPLPSDHHS